MGLLLACCSKLTHNLKEEKYSLAVLTRCMPVCWKLTGLMLVSTVCAGVHFKTIDHL